MRIGFAGLGRMGAPMAERLVPRGQLTVWNRTTSKGAAIAARLGAHAAATPAELAAVSDIVVTVLADDAGSEAVHRDPDGLFAGVSGPLVIVEMGTVSPAHIAALAKDADFGVRIVDAPVSGAMQAARDGALTIMVDAHEPDVADLAPLFAAAGRHTVHLGERGARCRHEACRETVSCTASTRRSEKRCVLPEKWGWTRAPPSMSSPPARLC